MEMHWKTNTIYIYMFSDSVINHLSRWNACVIVIKQMFVLKRMNSETEQY